MGKRKARYYVRPDGLHEAIRVINGKRVAFRGATDAEVERKMIAYREDLQRGRDFAAVARDFCNDRFPSLAANTLRSYNAAYDRAVEHFGKLPIRSITPPQIKAYINAFAAGRARKTVTTQRQMINMIFRWAVEHGDIEQNPCAEVTIPKGLKRTYRQPASDEDIRLIRENADKWLLPYFLLYTGLRKGEALAIQGKDINLREREIYVRKSVYYENRKPKIKAPKTEKGVRVVPILDPLIGKLPRRLGRDEFLFSADGLTPYGEGEYEMLWKHYARETGIRCTAHQLRHSYAIILLDSGLDLKDRQDLLGHTTAAMTNDVYTHILSARRKESAAAINARIAETSGG